MSGKNILEITKINIDIIINNRDETFKERLLGLKEKKVPE